jgi:hypothetical protein
MFFFHRINLKKKDAELVKELSSLEDEITLVLRLITIVLFGFVLLMGVRLDAFSYGPEYTMMLHPFLLWTYFTQFPVPPEEPSKIAISTCAASTIATFLLW